MALTFAALWTQHPAVCGVLDPCCDDNGEPNYDHQCAIRMGVALVRAGLSLDEFDGARCWHRHEDGQRHVLRAQELASWLRTQVDLLGEVQVYRKASVETFAGRTGIVFFKDFWGTGNRGDHIDVWDGTRMGAGDDDYFERAKEVWFWPLG